MTTAYCFDPEHIHHRDPDHPERPDRLTAVMTHLRRTGQLERLAEVPIARAPLEAIALVHPEPYATVLESFCVRGGGRLDADTYATEVSFRVARRALGGLLGVADAVAEGRADNGFALIRPPGHHARPMTAMGFCLLGNAAIAARHVQQRHGAERVLVLDFDVHHGNGTQEMLEGDRSMLFVSSHQYPHYPGSGGIAEVGPFGQVINVPYPAGTGDAGLLEIYRRVLFPAAERFRPDFVVVSAGFDAHFCDPLADARLTVRGFADLMLVALEIADAHCGNRLVATLEGGYDPPALAASVAACLAVMEDPSASVEDPLGDPPPGREADLSGLLADLRALHRL